MEYAEPGLDGLLEGSDDEEEGHEVVESSDSNMLNVDELMAIDDSSKVSSRKANSLFLDMIDTNNDSDNSEDDEDGERNDGTERSNINEVDNGERNANREKIIKMLSLTAPGINLFPVSEDSSNGFCLFTLKTLSLERDLDYSRRGKLLGHGFTNERLDDIFNNRFEFVRHLFPEAQSVLLCDKKDFKSIMNFLLYSISVCTDENLSDLMTKSFFDLRRNYGFRQVLFYYTKFCTG